jgi:hypothetical protein
LLVVKTLHGSVLSAYTQTPKVSIDYCGVCMHAVAITTYFAMLITHSCNIRCLWFELSL